MDTMAVAVIQRPLRGSRISSFYPVKSLPALSSLDSAFQLQEYISLLIRLDVHDVETIVSIPGKGNSRTGSKEHEKERSGDGDAPAESDFSEDNKGNEDKDGDKERKNEVTVDKACWIYEQLRRLAQDLTHPLITMLQQECTRATCPEMKAGEWLYLCVAHGTDGSMESCCAIDYILHTLDSATALLNSPRTFPSRLQIPAASHRHFSSLARRLGRIFAHAYFHHREAFEQAEAESSLYARFLALTSKFDLVPAEFLVIPPRFGHHDGVSGEDNDRMGRDVRPPRLLNAALHPQHPSDTFDHVSEPVEASTNIPTSHPSGPPGLGIDTAVPTLEANESGNESPRKFGRSRTDTMVLSDASIIAEELAKAEPTSRSVGEITQTILPDKDNFTILEREDRVEPANTDVHLDATSPPKDNGEHASSESASSVPSNEVVPTPSSNIPSSSSESIEAAASIDREGAPSPEQPSQEAAQPLITPSSSTAPAETGSEPVTVVFGSHQEVKLSPDTSAPTQTEGDTDAHKPVEQSGNDATTESAAPVESHSGDTESSKLPPLDAPASGETTEQTQPPTQEATVEATTEANETPQELTEASSAPETETTASTPAQGDPTPAEKSVEEAAPTPEPSSIPVQEDSKEVESTKDLPPPVPSASSIDTAVALDAVVSDQPATGDEKAEDNVPTEESDKADAEKEKVTETPASS